MKAFLVSLTPQYYDLTCDTADTSKFLSALATFTASAPVTINRRATNQVFSATQAAANNVYDGIGAGLDNYKLYTGDGSASAGWPSMTEWVSFQQM